MNETSMELRGFSESEGNAAAIVDRAAEGIGWLPEGVGGVAEDVDGSAGGVGGVAESVSGSEIFAEVDGPTQTAACVDEFAVSVDGFVLVDVKAGNVGELVEDVDGRGLMEGNDTVVLVLVEGADAE
jgi:hypothetical protein